GSAWEDDLGTTVKMRCDECGVAHAPGATGSVRGTAGLHWFRGRNPWHPGRASWRPVLPSPLAGEGSGVKGGASRGRRRSPLTLTRPREEGGDQNVSPPGDFQQAGASEGRGGRSTRSPARVGRAGTVGGVKRRPEGGRGMRTAVRQNQRSSRGAPETAG